jgi:DNA-binding NarL/FixJ family response regulator
MLTASAEDADIAAAYHLGANAFLTKPSEASKLEEMVSAIKNFWLTHNTLPESQVSSPKSPMSAVCSSVNGFAAEDFVPLSGTRREERSALPDQAHEKNYRASH